MRELIAEVQRRGVRFEVVGDRLRAIPKEPITRELYDAIGAHKGEIVAILRETQASEERVEDAWDARLRRWVVVVAERIVSELCDECGRQLHDADHKCKGEP